VWTSQNIDPKHINPELTTSEPYVMGSHATCSGDWASGPEDYAPSKYQWGYNRMMTVDGLFGAGDASADQLQPGQDDDDETGKIDQPEDEAKLPEVPLADEAAAVIHRRRPRGIR